MLSSPIAAIADGAENTVRALIELIGS
jgi:hypothetical protein